MIIKLNWLKRLRNAISEPLERYYLTIDELPLYNWIQINKGEKKWLRRDINRGSDKYDERAYDLLYDHYIKEMGLGKLYKKSLEQMKEIAILQCDYIITGDRTKLTKAEIKMDRFKNLIATNNKRDITIEQTLVFLSKWINSFLDVNKLTARQYFDLLEAFDKENKQVKANGKENNT